MKENKNLCKFAGYAKMETRTNKNTLFRYVRSTPIPKMMISKFLIVYVSNVQKSNKRRAKK